MDKSADPCTDFFQYACGSWNRKHVIPEDRSSISTFEVLADQLQIILKGMNMQEHLLIYNTYNTMMQIKATKRCLLP